MEISSSHELVVGCARLDGGRGAGLSFVLRSPLRLSHSLLMGAWNLRLEHAFSVPHHLRQQCTSDDAERWLVSSAF